MGGYGSGRTQTYSGIAEWLDLPMQRVKSLGYLVDGQCLTGTVQWTFRHGGRVTYTATIGLTVRTARQSGRGLAIVNYSVAGKGITESIPLVYQHRTWYFVCLGCGHKRRNLYAGVGAGVNFRCRVCYHLIYTSSRESSQGKSDAYRALTTEGHNFTRAAIRAADRSLIFALQALDRHQQRIDRLYQELGCTRAHQLAATKRARKRAATKRWRNHRRRERYHQRKHGLLFP